MNFIALYDSWRSQEGTYEVSGAAAEELIVRHGLKKDLLCKAVQLGIAQVEVRVTQLRETFVQFDVAHVLKPVSQRAAILFVAVSRPQTVKKVLELSATFGVHEIHFFRAAKTEKSYLTSKVFDNTDIHLTKGIEQSGSHVYPQVYVHKFYKPFISDIVPACCKQFSDYEKCLLDMRTDRRIAPFSGDTGRIIVLGPEAGFKQYEIDDFSACGFKQYSLGELMLRVESALTAALAFTI